MVWPQDRGCGEPLEGCGEPQKLEETRNGFPLGASRRKKALPTPRVQPCKTHFEFLTSKLQENKIVLNH